MLSRESDELLAGVLGGSLDLALVANFDVVYWVCGYVCIVCLLSRESTELYVVQYRLSKYVCRTRSHYKGKLGSGHPFWLTKISSIS